MKPRHLLWLAGAAAAAGFGYWFWRQNQPHVDASLSSGSPARQVFNGSPYGAMDRSSVLYGALNDPSGPNAPRTTTSGNLLAARSVYGETPLRFP